MPSAALLNWNNNRMPRLTEIDTQCSATLALAVPNPQLTDENLRGYVMLLSAHFQGYCRDLHTECVQIVAAAAPPAMQTMIQRFGAADRNLDGANPRYETIRNDFDRFGFDLNVELAAFPLTAGPNAHRITHLGHLNLWRNYAAHHKTSPPAAGGPLILPTVRGWRLSCDGLAAELDRIMYNQLLALTGIAPW